MRKIRKNHCSDHGACLWSLETFKFRSGISLHRELPEPGCNMISKTNKERKGNLLDNDSVQQRTKLSCLLSHKKTKLVDDSSLTKAIVEINVKEPGDQV